MQEEIPEMATEALFSDFNTKLRDIEERQKLIKDRVLLIGENLVDSKEQMIKDVSELRVKTESLGKEMERIKDTLSSVIEELQNLARKSEVEILQRQFKMFQPFMRGG